MLLVLDPSTNFFYALYVNLDKNHSEPSLLLAKQSQPPQLLLAFYLHNPLIILVAFHLTHSSNPMSFLSQADHNWTKHSRCGITSAEVKAHLPESAGNALPKAAQEFAGHKGALLAHVQLLQEHPSSLQRCFPVSQLPIRIVVYIHHLQVQDFALLSAELRGVPVHSFLQPVETPLNNDTII